MMCPKQPPHFLFLLEIIDELLHPDRVRVGEVAVGYESAGHRVGCGVDVHCESGEIIILGVDERINAIVLEEIGVVGGVINRGRSSRGKPKGRVRD